MSSIAVVQLESRTATEGVEPAVVGYESAYVNGKLELAGWDHDDLLVCTPDHGVIDWNERVEPDATAFGLMTPGEQSRWALEAAGDIVQTVRREDYDEVAVYADRTVRNRLKEDASLESRLVAAGAKLLEPLAGLGDRDRQTKWLAEQLTNRRRDREERPEIVERVRAKTADPTDEIA